MFEVGDRGFLMEPSTAVSDSPAVQGCWMQASWCNRDVQCWSFTTWHQGKDKEARGAEG